MSAAAAEHGGQLGAEASTGDAVEDEVDGVVEAGQLIVDGPRDDVRHVTRPVSASDRRPPRGPMLPPGESLGVKVKFRGISFLVAFS